MWSKINQEENCKCCLILKLTYNHYVFLLGFCKAFDFFIKKHFDLELLLWCLMRVVICLPRVPVFLYWPSSLACLHLQQCTASPLQEGRLVHYRSYLRSTRIPGLWRRMEAQGTPAAFPSQNILIFCRHFLCLNFCWKIEIFYGEKLPFFKQL